MCVSIADLLRDVPVAHVLSVGLPERGVSHGHVLSDAQEGAREPGRAACVRLLPGRGLLPRQVHHGGRVEDDDLKLSGAAEQRRL